MTTPLIEAAIDAAATAAGGPAEVTTVLDLGSGPGVATAVLAERLPRATVTAVDAAEALLAMAIERAAGRGLAGRVRSVVADFDRGFVEIAHPGSVDVVWASMVLHHLADLPGALRTIRGLVRPGGVLAVVELGDRLHGGLPSGVGDDPPGLAERHAAAVRSALAEHLPPGALSLDWPALLAGAGFALIESRPLELHLRAPLDDPARALLVGDLEGGVRRAREQLGHDDVAALDALLDPRDPRFVLHRSDLTFDIARRLFVARAD